MIVTRRWLEEWIDLKGISTEDICKKLNSLGLEVDSLQKIRIPEKIVVGFVKSCEKHPDADKLSVCQIDLGFAVRQIVCGAKNIREGLYVPVAMVGASLPNGMKIKHAKLRGIESDGMVCSATELGLPSIENGILELDESIGELEIGKELSEYPLLNDDVIEIELTANRGDCLSIYGVARELSVAFDRTLRKPRYEEDDIQHKGIGRILQFSQNGNHSVSLVYKALDVTALQTPLLIKFRLALINLVCKNSIDSFLQYTIHSTGVILRGYSFKNLAGDNEKVKLLLKEDNRGLGIVSSGDKIVSIVGISQCEDVKATDSDTIIFVEASYIQPELIAPIVKKEQLKTDPLYYRTSRGSEPDLIFGLEFLFKTLEQYNEIDFYAGSSEFITQKETLKLDLSIDEIEKLIGQPIELSQVVLILSRLGFEIIKTEDEKIILKVPPFRHDISNRQDVIEEIVRVVGIDNIRSKPICFEEFNRLTYSYEHYKYLRQLRFKAVGSGFYETVHYIFCDNKRLEEFGFQTISKELALLNPITNEMDGLRPMLMVNMLDSLQRNVRMSKKRVPLFEIGTVFDANRQESQHMLFTFSGEESLDTVPNCGKPSSIDFASFVKKIAAIIGHFELVEAEEKNGLMHPYQSADILIDGQKIGIVAQLHPVIQEKFDLPKTFFAEIDTKYLVAKHINAKAISSFTPIQRDLSIVVKKRLLFSEIRKTLKDSLPNNVQSFYPIDRYVDESLGDDMSLTLRFIISSMEKTLQEDEINAMMDEILSLLEKNCNARLR